MANEESTLDPKAIGIEASWGFGYGDAQAVILRRQDVRQVLIDNGVDWDRATELVPEFGSDDALKRALRYSPKKKHLTIKEFARPNKGTPRAIGIYVRNAGVTGGEAGDGWDCAARVRWDAASSSIVCLPPEGETKFPHLEAQQIGLHMADMSNNTMLNVMNVDLSMALTDVGYRMGWISRRRNSGGVYFLPADTDEERANAERFASILRGLAGLTDHKQRSHQFIPQVHELFPSPMTMSSWQGSAEDAFAAEVEKLQKDLESMSTGGTMRESTKMARAAQADEIIAKAERYRQFLGDNVEKIAGQLQTIQAAFAKSIARTADEAAAALAGVEEVAAATRPVKAPKRPTAPKVAPRRPARRVVVTDDDLFTA